MALEDLASDLKFAARGLLRNKAFSVAAISVLAIGIGASAAVFSLVDRLLFRSLPYAQADQLVSVGVQHPIMPDGEFLLANSYLHMREESDSPFASLASWTGVADCDLTDENALRLACAQVDSAFLPTFGITPIAGRNFTHDEDAPNARKVALISHGLWQRRFGGDRNVLDKTIPIDGVPTEVLGVLPADFELPTLQQADLVVPQALNIRRYTPGDTGRPLRVFGRLKTGISIEQAKAAVAPMAEEVFKLAPAAMRKQASFVVRSVRDRQIDDVKLASWILLATTLAILLIVCANVANLVLARAESRQREFAMRLVLGAGRWRLIRQTLVESLLLSGLGAALGAALAWALVAILRAFGPVGIPRLEQASLDTRVLCFLAALALTSGVLVGLAPAFGTIKLETITGWRGGGESRLWLRRALITAQIALSLTLLSDSSLLIESLRRMTAVSGGLQAAESVTTAEMALSNVRHPNAMSRQQFFDQVAGRLKANSLVTAVAISDTAPPSGFIHNRPTSGLIVVGEPEVERSGTVSWRQISPAYFEAVGIRILKGRGFSEQERTAQTDGVVLSASLAKLLFNTQEPIGRTIDFKSNGANATVIGVVTDADNTGIPGQSDPEYYMLRKTITDPNAGTNVQMVTRSLHMYDGQAVIIVRSAASTQAVARWIRAEVSAADPTCAITLATLSDRVRAVAARPRFNATLLTLFAFVGLVVAATGLYGLIAFLVAQRTREIGVRLALGATATTIASMVLTGALKSTAVGILLGLAGAIATARVLKSILFGIGSEAQIGLLSLSAATLIAVAVLASLAPVFEASRVNPAEALRHD